MAGLQTQAPARVRRPIETRDLSPAAVSRAVLTTTLQKPYVLYPAAVAILGAAAAILLGPSSWFVLPALAGAVVAVGAWAGDFFLQIGRAHV
jgi:hypothetical protein